MLPLELEVQDKLLEIGKGERWSKIEMDKIRSAKEKYEKAIIEKKKKNG